MKRLIVINKKQIEQWYGTETVYDVQFENDNLVIARFTNKSNAEMFANEYSRIGGYEIAY